MSGDVASLQKELEKSQSSLTFWNLLHVGAATALARLGPAYVPGQQHVEMHAEAQVMLGL